MEQRVQKFIQQAGYCSRRKAEELIEQGHVEINGKTASLGSHCREQDSIRIKGETITTTPQKLTYVIMNKPKGLVTSNSDELNRRTIFDILPDELKTKRLFSVGRLDKDTTGLLILTNDGDFSQKIIHPSSKIPKIYHVNLDKKLLDSHKKSLEKGIYLDDKKLAPCVIKNFKEYYVVKIWEGRKRQIRRMFEHKNYHVERLKRIRIGNLDVEKLKLREGKVKEVKKEFLEKTINIS